MVRFFVWKLMILVIELVKYEWVKYILMIGKDKSFNGNICDMG